MYKPGGTIADALGAIQKKEYVLPAIQREFVWKPEQIERLFDSLMQGYPFGTFLFWKVGSETSSKFKFYDFVLNCPLNLLSVLFSGRRKTPWDDHRQGRSQRRVMRSARWRSSV